MNGLTKPPPGRRFGSCALCCRFLRDLSWIKWNAAYNSCFRQVRPSDLQVLRIRLQNDETVPTLDVLEAAPALKTVEYYGARNLPNIISAAAFRPVIPALQRGIGLQALQEVKLSRCALMNTQFRF